jgi:GST-like protein
MITLYYNGGPNPMKVALYLKEADLAYRPVAFDTRNGDQFKPELLAREVPVIHDNDAQPSIFDSTAILLCLAEKRVFADFARRLLCGWRNAVLVAIVASGVGPFSGQAVNFWHYVDQPDRYSLNRYAYEADRHWKIVNTRLARRPYLLGATYSIAGMSVWGLTTKMPLHAIPTLTG